MKISGCDVIIRGEGKVYFYDIEVNPMLVSRSAGPALILLLATSGVSTAQFDGNRFAQAPSRIIQQQAYGSNLGCSHFVPGCSSNIVIRPCFPGGFFPNYGFGWGGVGYGGYYGNFADSYYLGSLQQQNADLRRRLDDIEARQRQADNNQLAAANPAPVRNVNRDRVRQERALTAMRSGERLFQKGSFAQASSRFEEALRLDDADPAPAVYLMQSRFATGDFERAALSAKEILRRNPDWPQAQFDVRAIYPDPTDLVPQIGAVAKHLKAHPMDADAMYILGIQLFSSGQVDRSKAIFEQAARLSPDDSHVQPFLDFLNPAAQAAGVKPGVPAPPVPEPDFADDFAAGRK